MAAIAIRGLSKSFGARDTSSAAVADLDLDIADNSFVTLLGPSGCGKTTTLRLIAGYIVPDKGHVLAGGRIVKSGGRELALELEAKGYGELLKAAAA